MEREMCQYLEWDLNVDLSMLKEFKKVDTSAACKSLRFPKFWFHAVTPPPTVRLYAATKEGSSSSCSWPVELVIFLFFCFFLVFLFLSSLSLLHPHNLSSWL